MFRVLASTPATTAAAATSGVVGVNDAGADELVERRQNVDVGGLQNSTRRINVDVDQVGIADESG